MLGAMRRSSVLVMLALLLACESSPREQPTASAPLEPALTATPSVEPESPPEPVVAPLLDLPEVAGVHYLEIVTGGAEPDAELPMIIALHGNGAYPALMAQATIHQLGTKKRPAAPFDAPARFIFLRGTEPVGAPGHARWFSITAADAQESPARAAKLATQIEARSHFVAAAIEELIRLRPTRGKPIITGHSQGAILTLGLAVFHPELFELAIPMAGWLPRPLWPTQPADGAATQLRIVALHGTGDTIVNFARSREVVDRLAALGWSIELRAYAGVKHTFNPMLAELRSLLRAAGQLERP